jgi:uncharacterized protein YggE
MKKWFIILTAVLLAAIVLTGCSMKFSDLLPSSSPSPGTGEEGVLQQAAIDDRSKLSVTTTESVTVVPDIAYVTLGVRSQGGSAAEAMSQNNTTANAVLAAIKSQGIAEEDIQTSNMNIYQDYDNPALYNVEIDYQIKVKPLDKVGGVIDSAVTAGANVSYSLYFDIEDRDAVYMQALQKAMTSVSDKASQMAAAGGLQIDRVLLVQEGGSNDYPMTQKLMAAEGAADSVSVSPGQMDVSATVSATYLLK